MAAALASSYVGDTIVVPPIQTLAYSSELDASIRAGKRVGGSTNARQIDFGGQKYIYKAGPVENVVNEFVAFLLFAAAGARVPTVTLVYNAEVDNLPMGILVEFIVGITVADALRRDRMMSATQSAIHQDMVFHALFANWDARNSENHMIPYTSDGNLKWDAPVAIDLGGALFYRAMGEPKADRHFLGSSVPELRSIPLSSSSSTSRLYEGLTSDSYLKAVVCSRWERVSERQILATADALSPFLGYLPRGDKLHDILAGRMDFLRRFCAGEVNLDTESFGNYYAIKSSLMKEITQPLLRRRTTVRNSRPLLLKPSNVTIHPRATTRVDELNDEGCEILENTPSLDAAAFTVHGASARNAILAARLDPVIRKWMADQTAFLQTGLSLRERDIIRSYTFSGDRLVNNYLRGTLAEDVSDLILSSIGVVDEGEDRPIPLAYAIYEQYPVLVRGKKLGTIFRDGRREQLLRADGRLNMDTIRQLIARNRGFFGRRDNIAGLIELYYRDLKAIFDKMPRPPRAITVFRGIDNESHLTGLTFINKDFLSTSVDPVTAVKTFTRKLVDERGLVKPTYHCCVYELVVSPTVPCMYIEGITQLPGEFEVLIAPGALVELDNVVKMKYCLMDVLPESVKTAETLSRVAEEKGRRVAVVDGRVTMPRVTKARRYPTLGLEQDVLENKRSGEERFTTQKPRSMKTRNGRRWVPEWKLLRNRLTRKRR